MGDWGANNRTQRTVARALADYVSSQKSTTFSAMLLAGDNFYTPLTGVDDPRWQTMFEQMYDPKILNFPFFVSLGNHDYERGKAVFEFAYAKANPDSRWKLPANWYRVDIPADKPLVTVLVLNSNRDLIAPEQWSAQLTWMQKHLSNRTARWTIAIAHHPLFSNGAHGDNGVLQTRWGPLFNEHKLDLYLCGHDHDLQHLEVPPHKPSFILCGGGGAGIRDMKRDNRGPFSRSSYGFVHLRFTDEMAHAKFVDPSLQVLHEFTRTPAGAIELGTPPQVQPAATRPIVGD
jgi:tartrate-resistant acid phosphatase type 5